MALASTAPMRAHSQNARQVTQGFVLDTTIGPSSTHDYAVRLAAGESVNLAVTQIGVDLVVEVRRPDGVLSIFDSPNGRNGDEPVEIIASMPGSYAVRVRPHDGREPAGKYRLRVTAWRDARATREMLYGASSLATRPRDGWRREARQSRRMGSFLSMVRFLHSRCASRHGARVIGIGEANHGSREPGDLRLSVTRRPHSAEWLPCGCHRGQLQPPRAAQLFHLR